MSVRLSVNVNKVATVRNSRGGRVPSVMEAVRVCVDAGAHGITVHPRADERHITRADVREVAAALAPLRDRVEYNIEGDPRPDWIALVHEVKPHQATLVPVVPGEITSNVGWTAGNTPATLVDTIASLQQAGVRVSLFIDAEPESVDWVADLFERAAKVTGPGAHPSGRNAGGGHHCRVELYTEPYARAWEQGDAAARASFARYAAAAERAAARGLEINAGHDLDHENLMLFRDLPHLAEVSIGHALIGRAIFRGLDPVVREYLAVLADGAPSPRARGEGRGEGAR